MKVDDVESALHEQKKKAYAAAAASPELDDEAVDAISVVSAYEPTEIRALHAAFLKLDADAKGTIDEAQLLELPHFKHSPLGRKVVLATRPANRAKLTPADAAAAAGAARISFRDFVLRLSVFAPATAYDAKLRLAFQVYDADGDKRLGRDDLQTLVRSLTPSGEAALDESTVVTIVDKVLDEVSGGDVSGGSVDSLGYDDFVRIVGSSDLRAHLTLDFR